MQELQIKLYGRQKSLFLYLSCSFIKVIILLLSYLCLCFPSFVFASPRQTELIQPTHLFSQENRYQPYVEVGGIKYFNQESKAAGIYDLFLPLYSRSSNKATTLFFSDLRIFDRTGSSFEGNAHIGYRLMQPETKQLYGIYTSFDRRKSEQKNYFNQITLGGEYWKDKWFIGGNLYTPIGKKRRVVIKEMPAETTQKKWKESRSLGKVTEFTETLSSIKTKRTLEKSLFGMDAEIGHAFTEQLTGYAGGYWFQDGFFISAKNREAATKWGPRLRLTYDYHPINAKRVFGFLDGLSFEAGIQHDKPRGTSGYIGFKLKVGLTNTEKTTSNLSGFERHITELVRRDPDIVLYETKTKETAQQFQLIEKIEREKTLSELLEDFGLSSNVTKNVTKQEIRKHYQAYARTYHPDKNKAAEAEEKFIYYTELHNLIRIKLKQLAYSTTLTAKTDFLHNSSSYPSYQKQNHKNDYSLVPVLSPSSSPLLSQSLLQYPSKQRKTAQLASTQNRDKQTELYLVSLSNRKSLLNDSQNAIQNQVQNNRDNGISLNHLLKQPLSRSTVDNDLSQISQGLIITAWEMISTPFRWLDSGVNAFFNILIPIKGAEARKAREYFFDIGKKILQEVTSKGIVFSVNYEPGGQGWFGFSNPKVLWNKQTIYKFQQGEKIKLDDLRRQEEGRQRMWEEMRETRRRAQEEKKEFKAEQKERKKAKQEANSKARKSVEEKEKAFRSRWRAVFPQEDWVFGERTVNREAITTLIRNNIVKIYFSGSSEKSELAQKQLGLGLERLMRQQRKFDVEGTLNSLWDQVGLSAKKDRHLIQRAPYWDRFINTIRKYDGSAEKAWWVYNNPDEMQSILANPQRSYERGEKPWRWQSESLYILRDRLMDLEEENWNKNRADERNTMKVQLEKVIQDIRSVLKQEGQGEEWGRIQSERQALEEAVKIYAIGYDKATQETLFILPGKMGKDIMKYDPDKTIKEVTSLGNKMIQDYYEGDALKLFTQQLRLNLRDEIDLLGANNPIWIGQQLIFDTNQLLTNLNEQEEVDRNYAKERKVRKKYVSSKQLDLLGKTEHLLEEQRRLVNTEGWESDVFLFNRIQEAFIEQQENLSKLKRKITLNLDQSRLYKTFKKFFQIDESGSHEVVKTLFQTIKEKGIYSTYSERKEVEEYLQQLEKRGEERERGDENKMARALSNILSGGLKSYAKCEGMCETFGILSSQQDQEEISLIGAGIGEQSCVSAFCVGMKGATEGIQKGLEYLRFRSSVTQGLDYIQVKIRTAKDLWDIIQPGGEYLGEDSIEEGVKNGRSKKGSSTSTIKWLKGGLEAAKQLFEKITHGNKIREGYDPATGEERKQSKLSDGTKVALRPGVSREWDAEIEIYNIPKVESIEEIKFRFKKLLPLELSGLGELDEISGTKEISEIIGISGMRLELGEEEWLTDPWVEGIRKELERIEREKIKTRKFEDDKRLEDQIIGGGKEEVQSISLSDNNLRSRINQVVHDSFKGRKEERLSAKLVDQVTGFIKEQTVQTIARIEVVRGIASATAGLYYESNQILQEGIGNIVSEVLGTTIKVRPAEGRRDFYFPATIDPPFRSDQVNQAITFTSSCYLVHYVAAGLATASEVGISVVPTLLKSAHLTCPAIGIVGSQVKTPWSHLQFSKQDEKSSGTEGTGKSGGGITKEQAKNFERFKNKLPINSEPPVVRDLPLGGKVFQAKVPGKIKGSYAVYEKQIDIEGKTISYTKTTYSSDGKIIHIHPYYPEAKPHIYPGE